MPGRWTLRQDPPALGSADVHVWRFSANITAGEAETLSGMLSPHEREQVEQFVVDRSRRQFIARRTRLRIILGRYLGLAPAEIRLRHTAFGKPQFTSDGSHDLRFNLSHSNGLTVVAVRAGHEVGVDVEQIQAGTDWHHVADRFFAPDEAFALRQLDPEAQRRAFFTYWCCKEAWLKARGEGLSGSLDRCRIALESDGLPRLLPDPGDPLEHRRWVVRTIAPGAGYAAALVTESPAPTMQTFGLVI